MGTNNKLREALSDATELLESILEAFSKGDGGVYMSDVAEAIDNARAALAGPVRNCDVGTAEEQYARWRAFCDAQELCRECKVYRAADVCASKSRCNLTWAQMPYEAEKGGAE